MTVLHSFSKDQSKQVVVADSAGNTVSLDGANTVLMVTVEQGVMLVRVTRPHETLIFANPAMVSIFDKEKV